MARVVRKRGFAFADAYIAGSLINGLHKAFVDAGIDYQKRYVERVQGTDGV
jgi:hypothetical protein